MHVLLAPDKFKGSLRASEVAAAVAAGLREAAPGVPTVQVPVADGGDGTLDAAVAAGYRLVPCRVAGPSGEPVDTGYAARDGVAVVELADACGLNRLPAGRLMPLTATSAGFGRVIAGALEAGCHRVVLGVGGSASTDGGAGMLTGSPHSPCCTLAGRIAGDWLAQPVGQQLSGDWRLEPGVSLTIPLPSTQRQD